MCNNYTIVHKNKQKVRDHTQSSCERKLTNVYNLTIIIGVWED
jgi:hypothetical protein